MAVLVHRALVTATLGACLFAASPALAQSNPGFFPARYVACHAEQKAAAQAPATPAPLPGLIAVPRKHAPITLELSLIHI